MMRGNLMPGRSRDELYAQVAYCHPIGRVGTTGDIAEAVLFQVSGRAAFITGAALAVDGGETAWPGRRNSVATDLPRAVRGEGGGQCRGGLHDHAD